MTTNIKMILDEVNARIKLAEAKTAEDPSNFDNFPGAEHDVAADPQHKKPDQEVKQEGPASRTEATGAEPGSDAKVNQDHLYEADEPVLTPEKKPAVTADANAKAASAASSEDVEKVASDILSILKVAIAKKASAKSDNKEAACGSAKKCETKDENKEKEGKAMKNCGTGAKCKTAAERIALTGSILDKIAEARKDLATKQAAAADYKQGVADAEALIMKLAQAAQAAQDFQAAQAAQEAGAADAEAALADAAAQDAQAAQDDQEAQGADGAEGEITAEDIADLEQNPVTSEEVIQAVAELVDEGQISPEEAAAVVTQIGEADAQNAPEAGDEGVTDEQIAAGIAQAIENGELSEDEAQQLVQELVNAGADETVADDVADASQGADDAEAAGAADAEAALADAAAQDAQAAGAADAEAALADAAAAQATQEGEQKQASAKAAQADQVEKYQAGFIAKCAEYNADPQKVAQYIQARLAGQL